MADWYKNKYFYICFSYIEIKSVLIANESAFNQGPNDRDVNNLMSLFMVHSIQQWEKPNTKCTVYKDIEAHDIAKCETVLKNKNNSLNLS